MKSPYDAQTEDILARDYRRRTQGPRKAKRVVNTVDLFCGAGGAETGLALALKDIGAEQNGLAINHWQVAVDTMKKNHPDTQTLNMDMTSVVPSEVAQAAKIDLLWASPSCTHHSRAKGGKPMDNQLRAQPELILSWLDQLYVVDLIVENVPEIQEWGPLTVDGRPDKTARGDCFRAWVEAIRARGYVVEYRVLQCADYGDATTRRRFFLRARKKYAVRTLGPIVWPEPTHTNSPQEDMFAHLKPWRGVLECLDLSDIGESIYARQKPLSANTMRRIYAGLRKFYGRAFQMDMLGANKPEDATRLRGLDEPIRTQHAGGNRTAVCTPMVVRLNKGCVPTSVHEPIPCITAGAGHYALATPIIHDFYKGTDGRSAHEPLGAQTTHDRFGMLTPMVMDMSHPGESHDEGRVTSADGPMSTQTATRNHALVLPFVVDYHFANDPKPATEPLGAQTTVRNHALATPLVEDGVIVDVFFRMLKPAELAAAHSFPADYVLTGTIKDKVQQIGNSVPVETARALCRAALERRPA